MADRGGNADPLRELLADHLIAQLAERAHPATDTETDKGTQTEIFDLPEEMRCAHPDACMICSHKTRWLMMGLAELQKELRAAMQELAKAQRMNRILREEVLHLADMLTTIGTQAARNVERLMTEREEEQ